MPRYKVIAPGYHTDCTLYKPDDPKHNIVVTDKPLKPIPSWLELIPEAPAKPETKRQRTARLKREAKAKAAKDEAKDDKKTADAVTFAADAAGDDEGAAGASVTTI